MVDDSEIESVLGACQKYKENCQKI